MAVLSLCLPSDVIMHAAYEALCVLVIFSWYQDKNGLFSFSILYLINRKILSERLSSLLMSLLVESDQRFWEALAAWEEEGMIHFSLLSTAPLVADSREVTCRLCR